MLDARRNLILTVAMLSLMTAGVGIYLIFSPKYADDFWYSFLLKPWFDRNGVTGIDCGWEVLDAGIPQKEILRTWWQHINMDCGRISNLAAMYFIILPKWFGSSIALGFWILCMIYSLRLARVPMTGTGSVALALFIWSFQLPWSNGMGCLDFQFNYLVPSGFMMWYLYWLTSNPPKRRNSWLVFISGLILGLWHEGFAVPVIVGGVAVITIYKSYRKRGYAFSLIGMVLGTILLFLCPGIWHRLAYVKQTVGMSLSPGSIIYMLFCNFTYIVMSITGFIRIRRKGLLNVSPIIIFAFVSGFVAIMLQFVAGGEQRIGWWRDLISTVALIHMLRDCGFINSNLIRHMRNLAVALSVMLTVGHWIAVDYYTVITAREYDYLVNDVARGDRSTVFAGSVRAYQLPLICLWTPCLEMFQNEWSHSLLNSYYYTDDRSRYVKQIPARLKEVTSDTRKLIPGGSSIRETEGDYFCRAELLRLNEGDIPVRILTDVEMSTGLTTELIFSVCSFTSEDDGKEYCWLLPDGGNPRVMVGKIRKINNVRI